MKGRHDLISRANNKFALRRNNSKVGRIFRKNQIDFFQDKAS